MDDPSLKGINETVGRECRPLFLFGTGTEKGKLNFELIWPFKGNLECEKRRHSYAVHSKMTPCPFKAPQFLNQRDSRKLFSWSTTRSEGVPVHGRRSFIVKFEHVLKEGDIVRFVTKRRREKASFSLTFIGRQDTAQRRRMTNATAKTIKRISFIINASFVSQIPP